jgi:hypothetical protein
MNQSCYANCLQIKKGLRFKISETLVFVGSPYYSKLQLDDFRPNDQKFQLLTDLFVINWTSRRS